MDLPSFFITRTGGGGGGDFLLKQFTIMAFPSCYVL